MNYILKKSFYLVFFIAVLVSVQELSADMIYLKTGGVIIGKIINQTAKEVIINENGATRTVKKTSIARIQYGDPNQQSREIEAKEAAAKQEAEDKRKAEAEQNRRIDASATSAAEETARAQAAVALSALNDQIQKDFAESERTYKERIRQLEERINFLDQRLREHEESVQAMRETVEYDRFKREEEKARLKKDREEFEARDKATRKYSFSVSSSDLYWKSSAVAAGLGQSMIFDEITYLYGKKTAGYASGNSGGYHQIPFFENYNFKIHSKSIVRGAGNRYEISLVDTIIRPIKKVSFLDYVYSAEDDYGMYTVNKNAASMENIDKPLLRSGNLAYFRDMYYFQGKNPWVENLSFHYGFRFNINEFSFKDSKEYSFRNFSRAGNSPGGYGNFPYLAANEYNASLTYQEYSMLLHLGIGYEKEIFKNSHIDYRLSVYGGPGQYKYEKSKKINLTASLPTINLEALHLISTAAYPAGSEGKAEVYGFQQELGFSYNLEFMKVRAFLVYSDGIQKITRRKKMDKKKYAWNLVTVFAEGSYTDFGFTSVISKNLDYKFKIPDPRNSTYGFGLGAEIPF